MSNIIILTAFKAALAADKAARLAREEAEEAITVADATLAAQASIADIVGMMDARGNEASALAAVRVAETAAEQHRAAARAARKAREERYAKMQAESKGRFAARMAAKKKEDLKVLAAEAGASAKAAWATLDALLAAAQKDFQEVRLLESSNATTQKFFKGGLKYLLLKEGGRLIALHQGGIYYISSTIVEDHAAPGGVEIISTQNTTLAIIG